MRNTKVKILRQSFSELCREHSVAHASWRGFKRAFTRHAPFYFAQRIGKRWLNHTAYPHHAKP